MKPQKVLEGKVAGIFSEKDLEQQDKFKGLAQDVLKTTIDELRKQQQQEREMDVFAACLDSMKSMDLINN